MIYEIWQQQLLFWIYFIVVVYCWRMYSQVTFKKDFCHKHQVRNNLLNAKDLLGRDVENRLDFGFKRFWIESAFTGSIINLKGSSIGFPVTVALLFPCLLLCFFRWWASSVFTHLFEALYEIEDQHQLRIKRTISVNNFVVLKCLWIKFSTLSYSH